MWPDGMEWINPPREARFEGGALVVTTGDKGDFWRDTYYGFRHDNGHGYLAPAQEFTAEVTFSAEYSAQYDQAGLLLYADEAHWIKAGIEHVNGVAYLAMVVTRDKSDWSQMPCPGAGPVSLRMTRRGDAVWLQYRREGMDWRMVRLAYFPPDLMARVGPAACSPSRAGLVVRFTDFRLGPAMTEGAY